MNYFVYDGPAQDGVTVTPFESEETEVAGYKTVTRDEYQKTTKQIDDAEKARQKEADKILAEIQVRYDEVSQKIDDNSATQSELVFFLKPNLTTFEKLR